MILVCIRIARRWRYAHAETGQRSWGCALPRLLFGSMAIACSIVARDGCWVGLGVLVMPFRSAPLSLHVPTAQLPMKKNT